MLSNPWVVIKFGGNSVADLACWQTIAEIASHHIDQQKRPLIVCSALVGITNKLEKLIAGAVQGQSTEILQDIIQNYHALSDNLSVDRSIIQKEVEELSHLATGITLLKEASPAVRAKILSFGEIILTKLGASYLQQHFPITWCDARTLLKSAPAIHDNLYSQYLSAKCLYQKDEALIEKFNQIPTLVSITQGFIASNEKGETVLLGRGGSDTSAAYFAAKLGAMRCEIWTDVPGIYTSNPHEIPEARLIKSLNYDEAQEIASMGAKVLHPYCILPVKANSIPLYVGYTRNPKRPGTEITVDGCYRGAPIKSILTKNNIMLVQIETVQMWQQAGFLADVFSYFKRHGVSIDLISTSESTVTVSLDLKINAQDEHSIENLLKELNTFCKATTIGPCAAVSIVGHNIRSVLPKIGQALKVFEEQKIYLVSQAANDLNLTFVVDENQAARLARKLHTLLIEDNLAKTVFEKSWSEEFLPTSLTEEKKPWWQHRAAELLTLASQHSPCYVYEEDTLKNSIQALKNMKSIQRIFYAMKANYYPEILKLFYEQGLGFECVSLGELDDVLKLFPQIDKKRIVFTPNFAPREEYEKAFALGVYVTVDNTYPFYQWATLFKGKEVILRLDPGKGHGHHQHVRTGGEQSKFGIPFADLPKLKDFLKTSDVRVIGLHTHLGSGILDYEIWGENALFLTNLLQDFPQVTFLNIGGGLGVPETPAQKPLDLLKVDEAIQKVANLYPQIQFWLEPGRFLVAQAGVLLATVTQLKTKKEMNFIGIDAGMNSLIRPALYGSYHEIVNLTRLNEARTQIANIVGPICESGDTLGFSRPMPPTKEGDIILIANAGAYGHVMSSYYNLRPLTKEYFLKKSSIKC